MSFSYLWLKISATLPAVARSMFWLNVSRVEYTRRLSRPGVNVTEGDFICEDETPTVSADVTPVVEWWIVFLPFLDELEPFMCLISYRV